jgi:hypothetical protein
VTWPFCLDLIGFWTAERDESAGTECVDLIDSVMAEPPFGQTGVANIRDSCPMQASLTRPLCAAANCCLIASLGNLGPERMTLRRSAEFGSDDWACLNECTSRR